ncbi:hypothetical protein B0H15DRAFT_1027452 [Mycena belliarum]|uniref:Uncharacterized protein n=1 Tax=Mycena belliarum TaxID=1033014 RepID=A0AAD6TT73_9AGAR|nr:hypothetical protein B0H15DRAFT_1027452 [Mycena belliae]
MPTRTSPRLRAGTGAGPSALPRPPAKAKASWRPADPTADDDEDDMNPSDEQRDDHNDENAPHYAPRRLDEPCAYNFKSNDCVWIRNQGKWIAGRIFPGARSGPLRSANGTHDYYSVLYTDRGHKLRRYFAPLLGELKPDTHAVRGLLRAEGWIDG